MAGWMAGLKQRLMSRIRRPESARPPFRLEVPAHLHRNSPKVAARGYEETGLHLMDLATRRLGLTSLAASDVLDVGCGIRFAQTIVNRQIPIRSYTGIEVYRPIVDFLHEHLEPFDSRFRFVHWDIQHAFFNAGSPRRIQDEPRLPVNATFDIVWLYSVFTHMDLDDARALLKLIRGVIRPNGMLLFTAFVDPDLDGVEGRSLEHPLGAVFYGQRTIEALIRETGWKLHEFHPGGPEPFIQPSFTCSPC